MGPSSLSSSLTHHTLPSATGSLSSSPPIPPLQGEEKAACSLSEAETLRSPQEPAKKNREHRRKHPPPAKIQTWKYKIQNNKKNRTTIRTKNNNNNNYGHNIN